MKSATIAGALALWAFATTSAQTAPLEASAVPDPEPFDHAREATLSIGQERKDGRDTVFATAGSGVIVSDGKAACLLTAKHMFFDPDHGWLPTQVVLRIPPDPSRPSQDARITVQLVINGTNLWSSPTNGADLAVLPLYKSLFAKLGRSIHAINVADFGDTTEIYQGANILALGYPALLGEGFLTTPLARGGIIAWDDPTGPGSKPFLVDANLYPGNSGGPVFHIQSGFSRSGSFVVGGGYSLIGIVSKGAVEAAQVVAGGAPIVATNPSNGTVNPAQAMVLGIGGIGIIEPISRAKDIVAQCLKDAAT